MSGKETLTPFRLLFFGSTIILSTLIGITVVLHDRNNYLTNYQDKQITLQVKEKTVELNEEISKLKVENNALKKENEERETQFIFDLQYEQKDFDRQLADKELEFKKKELDFKESIRSKNRELEKQEEEQNSLIDRLNNVNKEKTDLLNSITKKDELIKALWESQVKSAQQNYENINKLVGWLEALDNKWSSIIGEKAETILLGQAVLADDAGYEDKEDRLDNIETTLNTIALHLSSFQNSQREWINNQMLTNQKNIERLLEGYDQVAQEAVQLNLKLVQDLKELPKRTAEFVWDCELNDDRTCKD